ncbi:MAG TPA: hypothetical protein VG186_08870 [Solirubrobacteraceae bacterium]|nr:hypothetical protein [Solirubrobacteraceae bacterium]
MLSACGGGSSGNGVASKSANEIVTSALAAINTAKSAHIAGNVVSGTSPITLNLDLVSGQGGKGQMSEGGLGFQIEVIKHEVYINGSPAFWKHFGGAAAAQVFKGKWLKAPASGQFASLAQLSNLHALLATVLSTHGALTKTGTTTINGVSAVGVRDTTNGGTLYVATTGQPYPIEILKQGGQGGRITLGNFDQSVSLSPPANAIDISKFK